VSALFLSGEETIGVDMIEAAASATATSHLLDERLG
jgi:hypothetical protein